MGMSKCFQCCPDIGPQVWITGVLSKRLFAHVLRRDGTVNYRLINFLTSKVPAKKKSRNGVYTEDISLDSRTGVWCRVFVPTWVDPDKKLPIMVYFHGGGFALFQPDLKEYDSFCRHMSKMYEIIVISVSYRLSPEHKHPAAYEDGFMALEWVRSQANEPNENFPSEIADFSRVFLAGDSAGGNLAHHVAVKAGTSDLSPISLAGMILIQPFFGGVERTVSEIQYRIGTLSELADADWYWNAFLPPGTDRDHPSSNVCGPKSPAFHPMNLPRILVVVGGKDSLRDRQIQYAEAMQSADKECKLVLYEKAFHGFYMFRHIRSTTLFHDEIEEFINPSTDGRKSVAGSGTPRASTASFLERIMSCLTAEAQKATGAPATKNPRGDENCSCGHPQLFFLASYKSQIVALLEKAEYPMTAVGAFLGRTAITLVFLLNLVFGRKKAPAPVPAAKKED